jgi:hypothetical protein
MNNNKPVRQMITTEVQAGEPIEVGEFRLIPMEKATRFKLSGAPGGVIWNRPASVVAYYPDGESVVLPIKDHTRIIQIALLGGGIAMAVLMWLISGMARKK